MPSTTQTQPDLTGAVEPLPEDGAGVDGVVEEGVIVVEDVPQVPNADWQPVPQ